MPGGGAPRPRKVPRLGAVDIGDPPSKTLAGAGAWAAGLQLELVAADSRRRVVVVATCERATARWGGGRPVFNTAPLRRTRGPREVRIWDPHAASGEEEGSKKTIRRLGWACGLSGPKRLEACEAQPKLYCVHRQHVCLCLSVKQIPQHNNAIGVQKSESKLLVPTPNKYLSDLMFLYNIIMLNELYRYNINLYFILYQC